MGTALLLCGVGLMVLGLWLPSRVPAAFGTLLSLLAPIGGALALMGVILTGVPDFLEPAPPPPLEAARAGMAE